MVLNRSLEYGFNGYQVPAMPRAARSARKRGSVKKKGEDYSMCAFDLLATVAGKLLVGKDSSPSSSNLSTKQDQCTITRSSSFKQESAEVQPCDQGSSDRDCIDFHNDSFKEILHPVDKNVTGFTGVMTTLDSSGGSDETGVFTDKVVVGSSEHEKSVGCKSEVETKKENVVDVYSLGDPVVWDAKPLAQISSDIKTRVPFKETQKLGPSSTISPVGNNVVLLDSRDDDENSSGCTHRSTTKTSVRSTPCLGDRRIRKVLASKYWKVATKWKDKLFPRNDVDVKTEENKCYKRLRSERNYPFKKRKCFDLNSESNSDGEVSGDGSANWPSPSMASQHLQHQSADPHVRLRIESFKVPELFIEIPENATVGSLKRAVMEAVTTVLGGELRVGILLQGKKVGDDTKTLLQTGICHVKQTDVLGFTLEPSSSQDLPSGPVTAPVLLHCNASQPHPRYPRSRIEKHEGNFDVVPELHRANLGNSVESDRDSATSPVDMSTRGTKDSKALMPASPLNRKALAVVPVRRKSKQSEMAQRRIRRPFSVAEVEALVQAVEKLGTGRWRDVKLRAFDSAKHRTYVDLKDKWKTLVHTARISPQQRRGEPVPQELLDRVLSAHAYWSQRKPDNSSNITQRLVSSSESSPPPPHVK